VEHPPRHAEREAGKGGRELLGQQAAKVKHGAIVAGAARCAGLRARAER
jgi:hypothetical protein